MKIARALAFFLVLLLSKSSLADWVLESSAPLAAKPASRDLRWDYNRLLDYWQRQKYKKVVKLCDRLLKISPVEHQLIEELYYLKAEALYQLEKLSRSQKSFEKLVREYPHTEHLHEVTKRQLDIARAFLGNFRKKLLGLPLYRTPSKGIAILESIFERDPRGSFADHAQIELANYYFRQQNYLEAGGRYKLVHAHYPQGNFRELAAFRWAQCMFLEGQGPAYDPTYLTESRHAFEAFLAEFPQSKLGSQARQARDRIVALQAQNSFDTARFYERGQHLEAALLYYRITANRFPEARCARQARDKIRQLTSARGSSKQ